MRTQGCLFLLLLCAGLSQVPAVAGEHGQETRSVSVIGTATANVQPDIVEWNIQLNDRDPVLDAAKGRNDTRMRAALDLLGAMGVGPQDIQTSHAYVSKVYARDAQGTEGAFKHFQISRNILVQQRDLTQFDTFYNKLLGTAEAEVSFSMKSSAEETLRMEVRRKATRIAREKAEAMLGEVGAKIGPILTLEENLPNTFGGGMYSTSNTSFNVESAVPPTDVSQGSLAPGTISVTVSIRAKFAIADEPAP